MVTLTLQDTVQGSGPYLTHSDPPLNRRARFNGGSLLVVSFLSGVVPSLLECLPVTLPVVRGGDVILPVDVRTGTSSSTVSAPLPPPLEGTPRPFRIGSGAVCIFGCSTGRRRRTTAFAFNTPLCSTPCAAGAGAATSESLVLCTTPPRPLEGEVLLPPRRIGNCGGSGIPLCSGAVGTVTVTNPPSAVLTVRIPSTLVVGIGANGRPTDVDVTTGTRPGTRPIGVTIGTAPFVGVGASAGASVGAGARVGAGAIAGADDGVRARARPGAGAKVRPLGEAGGCGATTPPDAFAARGGGSDSAGASVEGAGIRHTTGGGGATPPAGAKGAIFLRIVESAGAG